MGAELLRVAKLAKSFGAYQVLQDVRFDVNEGEIVGLLGPNGSGKSTALNIISGFMSGDGGQVLFQGNDITQARVQEITRSGLIRTFQLPSMPHRMTVREVVRAGQSQASNMLAPIRFGAEVDSALKTFELTHVGDLPASSLSGGQKKLLSVATALQSNPKLLCLDEPTAGVHVSLRRRLVDILRGYVSRGGACLVVEHDMVFIRELCTRCVVLDRGEIIADCKPDELESIPRVVEAYLGKAVERKAAQ